MPPLTKEVMQGVFDAFGDTVQSTAFLTSSKAARS